MTLDSHAARGAYRWVAAGCVAALLVTAGLYLALRDTGGTRISALFDKTVGLYAGSSVRVLGVPVGEITGVTPEGAVVRVDMRIDGDVRIPAGAGAVVVAPSLVSDRYVQLTPAYDSGPVMAPGTVIPQDHTATPMELDDLYSTLDKLSTGLGPDGANAHGALSDLLNTAAANLDGNGLNLNSTVTELANLSRTLDDSKDDLFATVRNLQSFTTTLAGSDAQLDEFYRRLGDVTGFLAADSGDVSAALAALGSSLGDVQSFVAENKDLLTSNVDKLASITQVLVDQRAALAEVLDVGPTGMTNFINSYDAASGSIAIRYNANEFTNPLITTLCRLIKASTPVGLPTTVSDVCQAIAPVVEGIAKVPSIPQLLADIGSGKLPPLPLLPLVDIPEAGR
ncbi:MCE family protein [Amycolatopsis viridis]|uniref:Virulence factor Mce-like protein n=1 Tax=Amycolatopsis viridis TaxID=185678 RepID=A0ABX0SSB9_9PSEU|nr:MCE family protein [Amycolatopsis viridis]NIH79438.1 virulence factor Mce-like protein [Amycolatopsis viridis]